MPVITSHIAIIAATTAAGTASRAHTQRMREERFERCVQGEMVDPAWEGHSDVIKINNFCHVKLGY